MNSVRLQRVYLSGLTLGGFISYSSFFVSFLTLTVYLIHLESIPLQTMFTLTLMAMTDEYVDIRKIKTLTFHKGQTTNSKNLRAQIKQLQPQHYGFEPNSIECNNLRYNGNYPRW